MRTKLFIKPIKLERIADILIDEIKDPNKRIVSRFSHLVEIDATFTGGNKSTKEETVTQTNIDYMDSGIYSRIQIYSIDRESFPKISEARNSQVQPYKFQCAKVSLPTIDKWLYLRIPSGIGMYDNEFREFTHKYSDVKITRQLSIEEKVVVNSKGGWTIQIVPLFRINYQSGLGPSTIYRSIGAVCTKRKDIRNLPRLIKYIPDPTPDKRIQKSSSFSEAFELLYGISQPKYKNFEEADVSLDKTQEIIIGNGTGVHEIFHTYEIPVGSVEENTATFRYGQPVANNQLSLVDNPTQEIDGFLAQGFAKFDAYGRERPVRELVKDGIVTGYLGSDHCDITNIEHYLDTDKIFVGNATQDMGGLFPQARSSCITLDGSTEDISYDGKLLVVPTSGGIESDRDNYRISAQECYVIKDGEPHRTPPLKISGKVSSTLSNIVLLPSSTYEVGLCRVKDALKDQWSQVPVSEYTHSQLWSNQKVEPRLKRFERDELPKIK